MDLTERLDKHLENIKEDSSYLDSLSREIKENVIKYFKNRVKIDKWTGYLYRGNPENYIISITSPQFQEETFIDIVIYPKYVDIEASIEIPKQTNRVHDIIKNYKINYSSLNDLRNKIISTVSKFIIDNWTILLKTPSKGIRPDEDPEIEKFRKIRNDNFNKMVNGLKGILADANAPEETSDYLDAKELQKRVKQQRSSDSREVMQNRVLKEISEITYRIKGYNFICTNRTTCEREKFLKYKDNRNTYPQFIIEFPGFGKNIKINGKEVFINHSPSMNEISIICDDGKPWRNVGDRFSSSTPRKEVARIIKSSIRPYVEQIKVPFNNWPLPKIVKELPKIIKEVVEDFLYDNDYNESLISKLDYHLSYIKEDSNWHNFMQVFNKSNYLFFDFYKTNKGSEIEFRTASPYRIMIYNKQASDIEEALAGIKGKIFPHIIISFPGDWENRNSRDSKTVKIIKVDSPNKRSNIAIIPFDPNVDRLYKESDIVEMRNLFYGRKIIPIVKKLINSDKNFENKPVGVLKLKHSLKSIFQDFDMPQCIKDYYTLIYSPLEEGVTFEEYIKKLKAISNTKLAKIGIDIVVLNIKTFPRDETYSKEEFLDMLEDDPIYYILGEDELEDAILEEVDNWELLTGNQIDEFEKLTDERVSKLIWDNRQVILQKCKEYIKGE